MRQSRQPKGSALGATLLVVVLLFVFGLTLANLATFDLRLVNRDGERQKAFEAAEAGLNRVTAELGKDPRVGTNNEVFTETMSDGGSYRVTFDPSEPGGHWSLNNLAGLVGASRGSDRTVPANHALIVSVGTSKAGEIAEIESLIRLEALPYAVAGSNKVRANQVTVFGAYTGAEAQAARVSGDRPLAGHVYSGSPDSDSVTLGGASTVSGDVRTVGEAVLSGSTTVGGEVKTQQDPDQLPNLTIADFNTFTTPGRTIIPAGDHLLPAILTGTVYIDDDVNFLLGAVCLDATIYVDGNFQTTTLAGTGTLFVNGESRFLAAVNLTGGDRLTVFSEGDITIDLAGVFQGVFLTHGNFTSNALLVVLGAIYANNPGEAGSGNVNLNGISTVVHVQEYTAFASYWLALGGEAEPQQVYWSQLR